MPPHGSKPRAGRPSPTGRPRRGRRAWPAGSGCSYRAFTGTTTEPVSTKSRIAVATRMTATAIGSRRRGLPRVDQLGGGPGDQDRQRRRAWPAAAAPGAGPFAAGRAGRAQVEDGPALRPAGRTRGGARPRRSVRCDRVRAADVGASGPASQQHTMTGAWSTCEVALDGLVGLPRLAAARAATARRSWRGWRSSGRLSRSRPAVTARATGPGAAAPSRRASPASRS